MRFVVGLARQPDTSALQPGVAGDLLQGQPRTGLPLQNTWRSERERERVNYQTFRPSLSVITFYEEAALLTEALWEGEVTLRQELKINLRL